MLVFNFVGFSCLGKSHLIADLRHRFSVEVIHYSAFLDEFLSYQNKKRLSEHKEWVEYEDFLSQRLLTVLASRKGLDFVILDNVIKKAAIFESLKGGAKSSFILFNFVFDLDISNEDLLQDWRCLYLERQGSRKDSITPEHRLFTYGKYVRPEILTLPNRLTFVTKQVSLDWFARRNQKVLRIAQNLLAVQVTEMKLVRTKQKAKEYRQESILRITLPQSQTLLEENLKLENYYVRLYQERLFETKHFFLSKNDRYGDRYLLWLKAGAIVDELNKFPMFQGRPHHKVGPTLEPKFCNWQLLGTELGTMLQEDRPALARFLATIGLSSFDLFYHFPTSYNVFHFHIVAPKSFVYDYGHIFFPETLRDDLASKVVVFSQSAGDVLRNFKSKTVKALPFPEETKKATTWHFLHPALLLSIDTLTGWGTVLNFLLKGIFFCTLLLEGNMTLSSFSLLKLLHHATVFFPGVLTAGYWLTHSIKAFNLWTGYRFRFVTYCYHTLFCFCLLLRVGDFPLWVANWFLTIRLFYIWIDFQTVRPQPGKIYLWMLYQAVQAALVAMGSTP